MFFQARSRFRKQDFAIKALNNTFVHAAIVCCDTLELKMSAEKDTDICQKVVNSTVDFLKVLSYGAQSTKSLRKEQLKPNLHPLLKESVIHFLCLLMTHRQLLNCRSEDNATDCITFDDAMDFLE